MNNSAAFKGWMSQEEEAEKLQKTLIKEAKDEGTKYGFTEGTKHGIEQGSKQEKVEIAKNMLNKNLDIEIISEITGLTKEEIDALK